jgi:predicted metal-dependent hydrolase
MIPVLIAKWEKVMAVEVKEFGIKKMKTKWGTCSIDAQRIWLNLELAKKPSNCLEYIIIHEMTHLLERNHNTRFVALMNQFMPNWKEVKEELNRLPVSHTEWGY